MKKILPSVILVGSLLAVAGCTSEPQVSFEANQNTTQEEVENTTEAGEEEVETNGAFFDAEAASLQEQAEDYVRALELNNDIELLDFIIQSYSKSISEYEKLLAGNLTNSDKEFIESLLEVDTVIVETAQEQILELDPTYTVGNTYPSIEALHKEDAKETEKTLENTILRNIVLSLGAQDYSLTAAAGGEDSEVDLAITLPGLREQNVSIGAYLQP